MFGYVKPDTPYLFVKDETLYKALYCGVCKAIGSSCSQMARMSLTYDIAFLSAFAHNVTGEDVTIKRERCIAHPLVGKPMASRDRLTEKLAAINVILARYKVLDDVYDTGKGKVKAAFFSRGYKKAKKKFPEIEEIVKRRYFELYELEKAGEKSLDRICDPFAVMLAELSGEALGKSANEGTYRLFYSLGKWIYLIDALDDLEKDVKKGNYNAFFACYGESSFAALAEKYGEEVNFVFVSLFEVIREEALKVKFLFNSDLVKNVLLRGLPATYAKVINEKSAKKNKKDVAKADGLKKE